MGGGDIMMNCIIDYLLDDLCGNKIYIFYFDIVFFLEKKVYEIINDWLFWVVNVDVDLKMFVYVLSVVVVVVVLGFLEEKVVLEEKFGKIMNFFGEEYKVKLKCYNNLYNCNIVFINGICFDYLFMWIIVGECCEMYKCYEILKCGRGLEKRSEEFS